MEYPKSFLAIGNYILKNGKPDVDIEIEKIPIIINNKYRVYRKVTIGKDIKGRVVIKGVL